MKIWYVSFLVLAVGCKTRGMNDEAQTFAAPSFAGVGEKEIAYQSKNGVTEKCYMPKHQAGFDYSKGDLKDEAELCSYNFYKKAGDSVPGTAVNICPKGVSTNPGIEVFALPDSCSADEKEEKKLAKFKSSVTCSYTPSILAYYRLSRALGGAGDVPAAVLRTIDPQTIRDMKQLAAKLGVANLEFWSSWNSSLDKKAEKIFTDGNKTVYGGLSENPRGESRFSPINLRPVEKFMATSAWADAKNPSPVGGMMKRDFLKNYAQRMILMRDIADMVLLDYVLAQQDRFGNIHREAYYYYREGNEIKDVKVSKVEKKEFTFPTGVTDKVQVDRMLMKDNDCGMRPGSNVSKKSGLLSSLRHMSPKSYERFRWFAIQLKSNPDFANTFAKETAMTSGDLASFKTLVEEANTIVSTNCTAGKLLLDLNLEDHAASKNTKEEVLKLCSKVFDPNNDK